jgi:hypothetical protein
MEVTLTDYGVAHYWATHPGTVLQAVAGLAWEWMAGHGVNTANPTWSLESVEHRNDVWLVRFEEVSPDFSPLPGIQSAPARWEADGTAIHAPYVPPVVNVREPMAAMAQLMADGLVGTRIRADDGFRRNSEAPIDTQNWTVTDSATEGGHTLPLPTDIRMRAETAEQFFCETWFRTTIQDKYAQLYAEVLGCHGDLSWVVEKLVAHVCGYPIVIKALTHSDCYGWTVDWKPAKPQQPQAVTVKLPKSTLQRTERPDILSQVIEDGE